MIDHDKTINIYWWDMQIQATWCSGEWDTSGYSDCIKMRISHPEIYQLLCVEQAMIYQYMYIYIIYLYYLYIYISYIYISYVYGVYIYMYDISRDFMAIFRGHVERRVRLWQFPAPGRFSTASPNGDRSIFLGMNCIYIYIYISADIYIYCIYI